MDYIENSEGNSDPLKEKTVLTDKPSKEISQSTDKLPLLGKKPTPLRFNDDPLFIKHLSNKAIDELTNTAFTDSDLQSIWEELMNYSDPAPPELHESYIHATNNLIPENYVILHPDQYPPVVPLFTQIEGLEQHPYLTWPRMTYDKYCDFAYEMGLNEIFTPTIFQLFPKDEKGRISIRRLHRYFVEKSNIYKNITWLYHIYPVLRTYWVEEELSEWIRYTVESSPVIMNQLLDVEITDFYIATATRGFSIHFSNSLETKNIQIDLFDLASSPLYNQFHEACRGSKSENNWFVFENVYAVYQLFMSLDVSQNGLLSTEELYVIYDHSYSPFIIERYVELVHKKSTAVSADMEKNSIDFKAFLDLILISEYPQHRFSIETFFKLLDVYDEGKLSIGVIQEWAVFMMQAILNRGDFPEYVLTVESIVSDFFQITRCENQEYVTLDDLLYCKQGYDAVGILTNIYRFGVYEVRESHDTDLQPSRFLFLNRVLFTPEDKRFDPNGPIDVRFEPEFMDVLQYDRHTSTFYYIIVPKRDEMKEKERRR